MATTDTISMTTNDDINEIKRLLNTYATIWHNFFDRIYEINIGENFVNEFALEYGLLIPMKPNSLSSFYLDTLGNTNDELRKKIFNLKYKVILDLESFIIFICKIVQNMNETIVR